MFRVSYLNGNSVAHKGGFKSDKDALDWITRNNITALKLLVWSEDIQCFHPIRSFIK